MTQLISKMGARRVITMDLFDNRLAVSKRMGATHSSYWVHPRGVHAVSRAHPRGVHAVSKRMGATHSVNTSRVDPVAAVKEITNEMMCDIGAPP